MVLGVVAVVPGRSTARALAAGNWLAVRTLEALEPRGALIICVAFPPARLQVFGGSIISAAQGQGGALIAHILRAVRKSVSVKAFCALLVAVRCARFRRVAAGNLATLHAAIFQAVLKVVSGHAFPALRIDADCARFRRGTP